MRGGELLFVGCQRVFGNFGDGRQHLVAFRTRLGHLGRQFVPGARNRFREALPGAVRPVEHFGAHHHQVQNFARDLRRIENLGDAFAFEDLRDQRLPGDRHILALVAQERARDIGIRSVHVFHALQFAREIVESHTALEQVLRNRFLHQQYALAGNLGERQIVAHQHRVVSVGIIAHDDGRGVHAGRRRHVERFHIGHRAGVDVLGHESVERRSVIEALHLDRDAVLIRPFFQQAGFRHVLIGVPTNVDRPSKREGGSASCRAK